MLAQQILVRLLEGPFSVDSHDPIIQNDTQEVRMVCDSVVGPS